MSSSRQISTARAFWILGRLALRRQLNQWQSIRFARKRKSSFRQPSNIQTSNLPPSNSAPSGRSTANDLVKRSAAPSKAGGPPILSMFLFVMLAFNGFMLGGRGLVLLSSTAQNISDSTSDKIPVTLSTETRLKQADDALRQVRQMKDPV